MAIYGGEMVKGWLSAVIEGLMRLVILTRYPEALARVEGIVQSNFPRPSSPPGTLPAIMRGVLPEELVSSIFTGPGFPIYFHQIVYFDPVAIVKPELGDVTVIVVFITMIR